MVKGLSSGVVITVNAVCRISSEAGRTLWDEVTRNVGRTVTLFTSRWPRHRRYRGENEQHAKIETLPDEILLEIFDCVRAAKQSHCDMCNCSRPSPTWSPWEWHRLVHVCQRWRSLVFASPHRFDLRLVYTYKRKARAIKKAPDRWPTLPIAVWYPRQCTMRGGSLRVILEDENNASFALQHPNRIREINLYLTDSLLFKTRAQLLVSFPALEYLRLESPNPTESQPLPAGFRGSAPRLRHIHLTGVVFPTLSLLSPSTRELVSLRLDSVSSSGYFSPETLSISLSTMTRLESLIIQFFLMTSRETGSARRPLAVRAILPALTKFYFSGDCAYLEDLISRIDSPILERLFKPSAFETRQLSHFTNPPSSHALAHQSILLLGDKIFFVDQSCFPNHFMLHITSEEINSKATLLHIPTRRSANLRLVDRVDMKSFLQGSHWLDPDEIDSALWVDFFRPLVSVTVLEVAGMFVQIIGSVLEHLPEEMVRRVLPALHDLHVGKCQSPGPFQKFASVRRSSGCPLTVHYAGAQPTAKPHLDESRYPLSMEL